MPHAALPPFFHRPSIVLGNNILVTFYRQQDALSIDRKSDYRLINFV
jgi:hypothetical protein